MDIFCTWDDIYDESYTFKFRGEGNPVIFIDRLIPYNLISIANIEYIDPELGLDTIDDEYEFNEYSITNLDNAWKSSRRMNYQVTCNIGNAETSILGNTNPKYKPESLLYCLKALVTREIDIMYSDGAVYAGTTSLDVDKIKEYEFNSETAFDYSYKRNKSIIIDPSNPNPTGIPTIDSILRSLQRQDIKIWTARQNWSKY
ncbi:hypothetical protein M0R01_03745 [bacterium]|nr:hypothetical protein [bacterium]